MRLKQEAGNLTKWVGIIGLTIGLGLSGCNEDKKSATSAEAKTSSPAAAETVTVKGDYIRAMPPGQKVTALFMTLENSTAQAQDLVKAESDVSDAVELHEHKHENGMMKMGQVAKIAIPANGSANLEPGGYHVMLIGLKKDLNIGDKVDVKLTFGDGSTQQIQPEVKAIKTH